ncbi:MAG: phytanoyl-CoA dioxygenase family protein [Verrucomicrobiae bacterium]|nr:phytanoyl-CoA dioxygenase family protein [Verrucomicrobiae bacterium]
MNTLLENEVVSAEDVKFYREQGYLVIDNLIDMDLVRELRRDADDIVNQAAMAKAHGKKTEQTGVFTWSGDYLPPEEMARYEVNGIHDMQFYRSSYFRLLARERVLQLASALIGPNVMLHHTKLIYKKPRTGGMFPMHQDHPYFPHTLHSMMAISIHLDDTDDDNGGLRVIPGSHKFGPLKTANSGGQSWYVDQKKYSLEDGISAPVRAGGAVAFNYLTLHGSKVNGSDRFRRNILLQLKDAADQPLLNQHVSRGQGMILCGINPNFNTDDASGRH